MATNVPGRQQKEADLCMIEASLLGAQPGATLRPHLKTKQNKTKHPPPKKKQQTNKQNKKKNKINEYCPQELRHLLVVSL